MPIKFGTDGWRDIIAEGFTFDNVRLCAQGTASLLAERGKSAGGLAIGYDTRFGSAEFADAVAEVTTANGIVTLLCDRPAPTPALSYNVVARGAGGGVVITASHNSARWNGFKYKPDYGGSASQAVIDDLEAHIANAEASGAPRRMSLPEAERQGLLEYFDPEPPYLGHIATLVDIDGIRRAGLNIVVDSMFGAGAGYLAKLLDGGTTTVTELHGERNPAFPGIAQPEPIAQNLSALMSAVPGQGADVGLATDGDADRLGVVDETGKFITTLQTFALLCLHQLEVLERRGPLVRSITMTSMIDRLGDAYGVPVFDEPVGFKHLGPVMMREDALLAGEESGGYAFRGNIPERDGILSGLMLLEMMVKTGKSPSELLEMLVEKVGPHSYDRWDLEFDVEERDAIRRRTLAARPTELGGRKVEGTDTRDGVRFLLEGGFWALVRFSGTEPLVRIYAEAESDEEVEWLLEETRDIAGV
jgi:phosphomannomutase